MEVTSKGLDSWFLILLVICVSTPLVDSQLDANGFINIDCGRAPNSSFYDSNIKSTYVSDDQFIDMGENHRVNSKYDTPGRYQQFLTVRSFPSGTRNCYTLRSLTIGTKYLVRAEFYYANYDNLSNPPIFEVHLGVNYWTTMVTKEDTDVFTEIIASSTSDSLQVCLINKKLGTPFISVLHLSQLKPSIYARVNSTQSLVLYSDRENLGATKFLRYPDDLFDRIWRPYTPRMPLKNISTVNTDTDFATPSAVLQTADTTLSTTQSLTFHWTSDNTSQVFYVILHFSEIGNITSSDMIREFDILSNGLPMLNESYVPSKLVSGWTTFVTSGYNEYNVSLKATPRSTLPPLLNAFELYVITPATGVSTNKEDVTAVNTIKENYNVNKGWSGDPCVPTEYSWNGVSCTSTSTNIPRITTLDLSSSGLTGAIISSFGNLSVLTSLDLSNNDLSGDLPAFLDKLSALKFLDITGNSKLSTTLPPGLQSKKQDGNLIFKSGSEEQQNKKSSVVIIAVVIGVVVLLLIAAAITIFLCLRRRKYIQTATAGNGKNPQVYNQAHILSNANIPEPNAAVDGRLDFNNRQYSYKDLERITSKFQKHIGTGGFGSVYLGFLDDDTRVAVKMRSQSSSQGVKEFLAEAQNLARVHHKNLVSLVGYCMDGDYMALVYEYMQEGTLQNKLMDNTRPLSWKQRIRIAYESAHGLEYLHKSCNPPLIHRDVKATNILLNENLVAKIADFGLSREFNSAASSHVSTLVVGTPGYLDPEYYSSYQLSVKCDVFSFGVVLLEIITGKPPIIPGPEGSHLKQWVNQKLSRGDIESIVDPKMQGQYDINSVWKVTELALKCTDKSSAKRPTMSMVVAELKESLDLEISTEVAHGKDTANYNPNNYSRNENFVSDVSQNNTIEMAYMRGMEGPAPEAR